MTDVTVDVDVTYFTERSIIIAGGGCKSNSSYSKWTGLSLRFNQTLGLGVAL